MMTRHTDPTAVHLHRAYVPYSHVRRPQRVSVRQQMHGRIQPSDDLARFGRRINSTGICVAIALVAMLIFALQFVRAM